MARFLIRSAVSAIVTMLLVSILLFLLLETRSDSIAIRILGVFATQEQLASYKAQLGLNDSVAQRYVDWLVGSEWRAENQVGYDLVSRTNESTGEQVWFADVNGTLTRWMMEDGRLLSQRLDEETGEISTHIASVNWQEDETGNEFFWGVDSNNRAVKWVRGEGATVWVLTKAGLRQEGDGPQDYIPLRKGILRGDPGESLQYGRPVAVTLGPRLRNTLVLAGAAFAIVMPLALVLGILAGINEGKPLDRIISISSLGATATPEFVTGIFLILILGIWLEIVPAVAAFTSPNAIFEDPTLLILPVLTLTAVELGYVARMTRASMVEVMDTAYIRTATIKGMPRRRIVLRHALRNALLAPITIIMLHVNWLVGGVVVVEVIFGYPGLGKYIYDAAIFGDFNAIEAAAMVTVIIAVGTRLIGDFAYTMLNPRIRYA
jgi:peptide/nickel transport system permease protein